MGMYSAILMDVHKILIRRTDPKFDKVLISLKFKDTLEQKLDCY